MKEKESSLASAMAWLKRSVHGKNAKGIMVKSSGVKKSINQTSNPISQLKSNGKMSNFGIKEIRDIFGPGVNEKAELALNVQVPTMTKGNIIDIPFHSKEPLVFEKIEKVDVSSCTNCMKNATIYPNKIRIFYDDLNPLGANQAVRSVMKSFIVTFNDGRKSKIKNFRQLEVDNPEKASLIVNMKVTSFKPAKK